MTPLRCTSVAGEEGDCYRTCLAMILNVEPGLVPNFAEIYKDQGSFHDKVDEWLAQYGLATGNSIMHPETDPHDIAMFVNNISPGVPAIVSGNTEYGTGHSVVVCGGEVFNPGTSPIGLPFPSANDGLGGYWISFVVAGPNFRLPSRVDAQPFEEIAASVHPVDVG